MLRDRYVQSTFFVHSENIMIVNILCVCTFKITTQIKLRLIPAYLSNVPLLTLVRE